MVKNPRRSFRTDRCRSTGRTLPRARVAWGLPLAAIILAAGLTGACQPKDEDPTRSISAYRDRMLEERGRRTAEDPGLTAGQIERAVQESAAPTIRSADDPNAPPRQALLTEPSPTTQPSPEVLLNELPDPTDAAEVFALRTRILQDRTTNRRLLNGWDIVVTKATEYLKLLERPQRVELSLAECIERALANNYAIRAKSYDPAIEGTRLVEAEAVFDAEFFLDAGWQGNDQAVIVPQGTEETQTTQVSGGIRKLMPTGMSAAVGMSMNRTFIDSPDLPKQTNPSWSTGMSAELRQPLLRGFGLAYNRSQIEIARANRDVSYWEFVQEVRDRLLEVEQAYWSLVQVRRSAVIVAESVGRNYETYWYMKNRLGHDATPVDVVSAQARWESRYVDFLDVVKQVRDAEDALKNLLNDPELLLSEKIEIVPTDVPLAVPVTVDQFAEVRTALESRSEIKQARRGIDALRISTAAAKNQTLPQLDVTFTYRTAGVSHTLDNAWDEMHLRRHLSYSVGATLSVPIGNRARTAAYRRAQLQESQSVVNLQRLIDGVVQEVNTTVRSVILRYAQLPRQLAASQASEEKLFALQSRAREASPTFLETELASVEQLANNRLRLLQVLVDYNISLVELEKAKGTLLDYNNVVISEQPPIP